MSNVVSLNVSHDPIEEASEWIAKLDRGLTKQEKADLKIWLASDKSHPQLFLDMVKMWDKMASLSQLSDLFEHKPQQAKKGMFAPFAMAASILFATLISLGVWQYSDIGQSAQIAQVVQFQDTYQTDIGQQSTFFLQDKTKVELNTNSLVKVTYTDKQRLFELLQGEIHVTVAHNKHQPLSVIAGSKVIQAVGTAFNVELRESDVELIVTDGKVLVAEAQALTDEPLALADVHLPKQSIALEKGQKARLFEGKNNVVIDNESSIDVELAWQQGSLIFRGETLEQAMQEVSRYTDYQFEFGDEKSKQIQIAGLFKTTDINGLLVALEQNFNVKYEKVGIDRIQLSQN
ncbi:FecR domain-containing protein [Aliiglaciecola sp.]|nr:FecR domain-containing protein [Aliiglaciecola sp.]